MGLIPPLNGLRLFEAAARCGSFKLAAQELDITPGAVSHGVNSLDKWLDIELFDRTRGLVLTQVYQRGAVDDREGYQRSPGH